MNTAFDGLLAVLVVALALRLLITRELFEAMTLFVSFGLALALVWVRAGAVDVALAEIALGAGVTGALLINTRFRLERKAPAWLAAEPRARSGAILPVLCGVAAGTAAFTAARVPRAAEPLGSRVLALAGEPSAGNPVTAVLLEFRGYDTLLETAVLLSGVGAVWALERGRPAVPPEATAAQEPVLAELVRWIVPLTVIAAVYLMWIGSHAPGGAFQAGALLAGAGVLLLAAGFLRPLPPGSALLRGTVAAGLFVFSAAALQTAAFHGGMFRYPAGTAYGWILGIETVLTVSVAAMLADLFVDVPAAPQKDDR